LGGVVYIEYFSSNFNYKINNLKRSSLYNFKAFAIDENGIVFSEQLNFRTKDLGTQPFLSLGSNFKVTHYDYNRDATVIDDGGETILEKGFVFGLKDNPTINDNKKIVSGIFFDTLKNLKAQTKYFIKAYAITNAGIGYSQQDTFRTQQNPSNYSVFFNQPIDTIIGGFSVVESVLRSQASITNNGNLPNGIDLYARISSVKGRVNPALVGNTYKVMKDSTVGFGVNMTIADSSNIYVQLILRGKTFEPFYKCNYYVNYGSSNRFSSYYFYTNSSFTCPTR
jgi:hypothetical protein